jgi:nuclear GTP-binding protein
LAFDQPQELCELFLIFDFSNFHIFDFFIPQTALCAAIIKMGTGKKEASRKVRQGKVGDGMANVKVKGENFYR